MKFDDHVAFIRQLDDRDVIIIRLEPIQPRDRWGVVRPKHGHLSRVMNEVIGFSLDLLVVSVPREEHTPYFDRVMYARRGHDGLRIV